ncbi:MAG: zinc ABC transporter substrate-binding protein [Myxococcales bacterium]|nr:zinc ABC transporter substrate-binding protein [Myxococcales bacterium]
MKKTFLLIAAGTLSAIASAQAGEAPPKKKIACTIPTIEALLREIAGDRVEAFSLASGEQDPHFVSPTPSLMKRVREAELLLEMGMQLETWADEVANGSGNPRIFRGAPGRIAISTGVPKLEIPSVVTRAEGDVHPEGNPHLWLDPVRAKMLAANVARALKAAAPQDAEYFEGRLKDFQRRVDRALFGERLIELVGAPKLSRLALDGRLWEFLESNELEGKKLSEHAGGWLAKGRPLRGQRAVEFHKVWVYFARTFGFELVGTIEERPGIQPGPRHLSQLIEQMKRQGVRLVLVDNFYEPSLAERVAQEAGARAVLLPNQVGGEKGVDDYFALVDHVLDKTLGALGPAGAGQR